MAIRWRDDGIVLQAQLHGETALLVDVFTRQHGKVRALVLGGRSRKIRAAYEPGSLVDVTYAARTEGQLGRLNAEAERGLRSVLAHPGPLAALGAAMALLSPTLPETQAYPALFDATVALLAILDEAEDGWATAYVRWEVGVLGALGFGLDLSACAATGRNDQLAYVSPKTGRAVSLSAGEPYRDRLLPLPPFLISDGAADEADIVAGLDMTGYFLSHHLLHGPLPPARERLRARLSKHVPH